MALPGTGATGDDITDNRQKLQKSMREGQNRITRAVTDVVRIQTQHLKMVEAEIDAERSRAGAELEASREATRKAGQDEQMANATGKSAKGGGKVKLAKGGIFAKLGKALGGAVGGALGAILRGLAGGIAAFANPLVAAGAVVFGAFLLALGKSIKMVASGVKTFGQGLTAISVGMTDLDNVGQTLSKGGLDVASAALARFLEPFGFKNVLGAIVVSLSGNLPKLAAGIESLSAMKINKKNLEDAGDGMSLFLSKMGGGGLLDSLMGAGLSQMVGSMDGVAKGIITLDAAGKQINVEDVKKVADAMSLLHQPLADFAKGGIIANFVGSNALPDIAKGVTALGNVKLAGGIKQVTEVATAMNLLHQPLADFAKGGIIANFVSGDMGANIAKQIEALLATDTKNIGNMPLVVKAMDEISVPLTKFGGASLIAKFIGSEMGANIATQIEAILATDTSNIGNMPSVIKTLNDLSGPLAKFGAAGGIAKLVSGSMGENIKKQIDDLMTIDSDRAKVDNVVYALNKISPALSSFAGDSFVASLKGAGSAVLGFLSGGDSPMKQIESVGENHEKLAKGADALERISKSMSIFGKIKINSKNIDFKGLAEKLGIAIPLFQHLAIGGKYDGPGWNNIDFGKGILDPALRLDDVAFRVAQVSSILSGGAEPKRSTYTKKMNDAEAAQEVAGGAGGGNSVVIGGGVTNTSTTVASHSTAMPAAQAGYNRVWSRQMGGYHHVKGGPGSAKVRNF